MKVYDREGNVIEILDYHGVVLNEQARSARVLERRTGQFRLNPFLFWSGWALVILGWIGTLALLALSMLLWAEGSNNPAWASGFGGLFAGVATFFGMMGMVVYYQKHGIPKRLVEKPVEMYCKSCQQKLEQDLEIGQQQRAQELLTELATLGYGVPAIEASKEEPDIGEHVWTPPQEDWHDEKRRR
jgi:hypothetical protein